jgi:hypothetical protein
LEIGLKGLNINQHRDVALFGTASDHGHVVVAVGFHKLAGASSSSQVSPQHESAPCKEALGASWHRPSAAKNRPRNECAGLQAKVPSPSQAAPLDRWSYLGVWPPHPLPSVAHAHEYTRLRKGPSRPSSPIFVTVWVTQSLRKCGSCLSTRMRRLPFQYCQNSTRIRPRPRSSFTHGAPLPRIIRAAFVLREAGHDCCIAAPLMPQLPQQGGATRSIQALSFPNIFRGRLPIFHNGEGY